MRFVRCLLIVLIAGVVQVVSAEEEQGDVTELGKIIISSRRHEVGLSEISENVTVISEDEVKELPARNLSEALRYIAGVDIEPRQGFGRVSSVSIQGSDSRHVRVMIDGIPLNSQSSGQVDPAMFPIENIARIEVIKGAASSIWGSSLGGVINVITKDTGKTITPQGSFTTSFAEFHTQKESGEILGKAGDFGYYQFWSYMESGGKGPRDDVLEKKTFSKLSYTSRFMGKIIASFGYSGADANSGEFPDGTWQAQPYRARYGKVAWQIDTEDIDINIAFKNSRQDIIRKFFDSVDPNLEPFLIVRTEDIFYQLSINSIMHPREKDLLVLGADFDWDKLESTYLSETKKIEFRAPYANYTLKLEPWDLNFGLRYDYNSEFGQEFSPSAGVIYHLEQIPETLFRASISRAFNAPPLLWKYYELILSGLATNPDIGPERAWVYELGLESRPISKLWLKLSLYRADVTDAIAMTRNDLNQRFMKNFEKFRRQGAELQFKVNLYEGLDLFAGGAFNDIENRATKQTVRDGGRPRQSLDVGLEYKNKNGFQASIKGYYDRWNEEPTMYFNQLNQLITVEPNDRKMLVDLKLSQTLKNLTFFLNIYNLTNSKYWSDFNFPIPERYFEGGTTFRW